MSPTILKTKPKADANRYKARHQWYLADALLVVRELQAALWPLGWHVALGGGVLNHGYSDHDLDLYVLPIYREGVKSADDALGAVSFVIGALPSDFTGAGGKVSAFQGGSKTDGTPFEKGCFDHCVHYDKNDRGIDIFVVRRSASTEETEP